MPQGKGAVSGVVSGIFGIFVQYFPMATYGDTDILIDDRLVCEKLTIFSLCGIYRRIRVRLPREASMYCSDRGCKGLAKTI